MDEKDNRMKDKDKKCCNKNININAPIIVTKIKKKKEDNNSGSTSQAVIEGLAGLTRSVNETVKTIAETVTD